MTSRPRSLVFIVPGSIDTATGGYGYDRRMISGLEALGWAISLFELAAGFPQPDAAARQHAVGVMASIPEEAIVLVDGLALGALAAEAERESARLRLVALVHHPLAAELGIASETAASLRASERRALASVRLTIVTSPATAEALGDYGVAPEHIAVVEPGTDPAPLAHGSPSACVSMLSVAALVPRKGHDILFRALAALPNRNWHLTCVGPMDRHPETTARLREQLRAAGLEDRVQLGGEVDRAALDAQYDAADLFVLPTRFEGYGMAVAEALARGLPIVSTATGAIGTIVGEEAGLIVPPGDEDALRAALSLVLNDADLRQRLARGAARVRTRLPTWETAAANMARALRRVDGRCA